MKNTAKQRPLAERSHPLLPISIQVYEQQDPPCPLLTGFFGNLCYESKGEDGFHFPPHENIGPYKDMESVLKNRNAPVNQVYAFEVKENPWDDPTRCLFWINRYDAERDLPDTGKGWKANALVYFVTLAEMLMKWVAGEVCYELRLVVNGDTVKCLGGFWADDEDEALELAPENWMEEYTPSVWGVIPDTFTWSARLKRAMNDLIRWEPIGDNYYPILDELRRFGYQIDDVPDLDTLTAQLEDLGPEEAPPLSELAANFVRAWHIARSVISFDWSTADENTLRRHPFWLSIEPSSEYDAPQLTDQPPVSGAVPMWDEPDQKWNTFCPDTWPGYWRMSWKGEWTGMPDQQVVFTVDRSAYEDDDDNEVRGHAMTLAMVAKFSDLVTARVNYPWSQKFALSVFDEVGETIFPYDESLPDGVVEAVYGKP